MSRRPLPRPDWAIKGLAGLLVSGFLMLLLGLGVNATFGAAFGVATIWWLTWFIKQRRQRQAAALRHRAAGLGRRLTERTDRDTARCRGIEGRIDELPVRIELGVGDDFALLPKFEVVARLPETLTEAHLDSPEVLAVTRTWLLRLPALEIDARRARVHLLSWPESEPQAAAVVDTVVSAAREVAQAAGVLPGDEARPAEVG